MKSYDIIFAGGGAAGLSLAYHLAHSSLSDRSILIIDREVKERNDHTWCFWSREPTPFDALAYRTWDMLAFASSDYQALFDLAPYRYRMVRSIDFYRFIRDTLAPYPNIDFMLGDIDRVVDAQDYAEVWVNALQLRGDWVFDSRFDIANYPLNCPGYHNLTQHFCGWEIETAAPVFDANIPYLFDFRTPQRGTMRFIYILPYTERQGLIEYTLFSPNLIPYDEYEVALHDYLEGVLGVTDYQILDKEWDRIPMTDYPFTRRAGQRVMNIGTRGGRVKASSGYAFLRIQHDSTAIVRSLERHGHPFDIPTAPPRYHTFDAVLLQILQHQGHLGERIFTDLFDGNPIDRIFRFLDEEGHLIENLRLMATVPPWPFTRAWINLQLHRNRS